MDKAECEEAAEAVGAKVPVESIATIDAPCGCSAGFNDKQDDIPSYFNSYSKCGPTGHTNEVSYGGRGAWSYNQICKIPVAGEEKMDARDEHGQIELMKGKPFNYIDYDYLLESYHECVRELDVKLFREEKPKWDDTDDLMKSLEDYYDEFFDTCLGEHFFVPIRNSIELVFGDQVSPGYICGVKEAVKVGGEKIPGTCCLDAPYQLDGDDWGFKVNQVITCAATVVSSMICFCCNLRSPVVLLCSINARPTPKNLLKRPAKLLDPFFLV